MRLFMIFIALVIAVAAGIAFWMINSEPEEPVNPVVQPQVTQVEAAPEQVILIAREDIPVGKELTANDIDRQTWPAHLVVADFIGEGEADQVVDKVTRTAFKKGQPLVRSFLANRNDPGFLAAQLPAGMRAITIPVDAISGISGFVFPGDRVDILVKHRVGLEQDFKDSSDIVSTDKDDMERREKPTSVQRLPREGSYKVPLLMTDAKRTARPVIDVTEVLVPNLRVLAVGMVSTQYEGATSTPTNVTLEVTEVQAQMIRHAEEGSMTLALRSLDDADNTNLPRPVADADMSSLTPPAYFPYLYGKGEYAVETLPLEEVDYEAGEGEEAPGKRNEIVVIRGVEKETVGVDRQ